MHNKEIIACYFENEKYLIHEEGENMIIFLIVILMLLGGALELLDNLAAIIDGIFAIGLFLLGMYVIFEKGLNEDTILGKITKCLYGAFLGTVYFGMFLLVEKATGYKSYESAAFGILGNIGKKIDELTFILILAIVCISIVYIFIKLSKDSKDSSGLCNFLAIILMFGIYLGGGWLALKSSFNNSIQRFNLERPKYEVTEEVEIKSWFYFFYVDIGRYKSGTLLYEGEGIFEREINDTVYVMVTDGKTMGYVPEDVLNPLR